MKLLTNTNTKLKKSGTKDIELYSWSLPPGVTCPGADKCKSGCFGLQGYYQYPNIKLALANRHEISKSDDFIEQMYYEIRKVETKLAKKGKKLAVRVHAVGDFYSIEYAMKWKVIARRLQSVRSTVQLYAYTKSIPIVRRSGLLDCENFTIRFSEGGVFDSHIQPTDLIARVVESELAYGIDAIGNEDDKLCMDRNIRVLGLVYHGAKALIWHSAQDSSPTDKTGEKLV